MSSPSNPSGRSGATRDTGAVHAEHRRRFPLWLLLLGLLLLLLIIAAILIATLSGGSKKKVAAVATAPVAASPAGVPSVVSSSFIPTEAATAAAAPTSAATSAPVPASADPTDTAPASAAVTAPAPTASARASGPALVGGGAVTPKAATGTLAAGNTDGTVLFAENSAELTANAKKVIADAAVKIKAARPPKIVVTGYTDTIAGQPSNLVLSMQRAESVEAQLHNDVGPGPTAYSTNAIGEKDPVATNATGAGRQLNRRATITTD